MTYYLVVLALFLLVWPLIARRLNAQHREPFVVARGLASPTKLVYFTDRSGTAHLDESPELARQREAYDEEAA